MENPNNKDKQIIELHSVESDEGEIKYVHEKKVVKSSSTLGTLFKGVLGIAIGVTVFLLLVTFFIYFIIPLILIVILWSILSRLFRR